MSAPRIPRPGLSHAFDIMTTAMEAMEREVIRLEPGQNRRDAEAAYNGMKNLRDIRLSTPAKPAQRPA